MGDACLMTLKEIRYMFVEKSTLQDSLHDMIPVTVKKRNAHTHTHTHTHTHKHKLERVYTKMWPLASFFFFFP